MLAEMKRTTIWKQVGELVLEDEDGVLRKAMLMTDPRGKKRIVYLNELRNVSSGLELKRKDQLKTLKERQIREEVKEDIKEWEETVLSPTIISRKNHRIELDKPFPMTHIMGGPPKQTIEEMNHTWNRIYDSDPYFLRSLTRWILMKAETTLLPQKAWDILSEAVNMTYVLRHMGVKTPNIMKEKPAEYPLRLGQDMNMGFQLAWKNYYDYILNTMEPEGQMHPNVLVSQYQEHQANTWRQLQAREGIQQLEHVRQPEHLTDVELMIARNACRTRIRNIEISDSFSKKLF